jgi:hypothetical protein
VTQRRFALCHEASFPTRLEARLVDALRAEDVFIVSRRKPNGMYGFPNNFIEQGLGVSATSRNWTTITRIVERARL